MQNNQRKSTPILGGGMPSISPPDKKYNPASDFYNYVNHKWQRHIHVPPFAGSYGVSEEIEEDVRDSLLKLIETLRREKPEEPLSMLASSFLHTASQKNSVVDLQRVLNTFECISSPSDVAHSIGAMNRIQARAPLSCIVSVDSYDSSKCCVFLYETQLGLPEKGYYKLGSRNHILIKYGKLLAAVGKLMNIELLENAVGIEASLVPYLSEGDDLMNLETSYNPYSLHQLMTTYKNIDWRRLLDAWGLKADASKVQFIVTNPRYMDTLNRLMRSLTLENWRTWMRAQVVLSFLEYLPPPYDDLHFQLYGKALKGTAEKLPQKFLTLKVLQTFAKQDLGRVFVEHLVPDDTKRYATALVKKLKEATIRRLQAADWMADDTQHAAIQKVEAMKFQVAFPRKWKSETKEITVDPFRPLLNVLSLAAADSDRMLADLFDGGCKKDVENWDDGVFEVNAYYYPEGNMMVIPAGMLRAPFFDLERSHAWNLGGIGAVIGHEITHGFDADGRLYDKHGNYKNWWTVQDTQKYDKMTRAVVELFHGTPYMGGKVDGELTLSENLADLGGVAIALEALEADLPADPAKRNKAFRDFFTSFAVSWRQKDRYKKARQSLLLDSHAPPPLRVNLIVKQFPQFYQAFDIPDSEPHIVFW